MVKELPQIKKGLKEFILDEDARVIDRSATKVAITATFIATSFILNAEDANAKGHHDHNDHSNNLNAPNTFGTGIHGGTNPLDRSVNEIPVKSVETMHANHYNHQDASGGQGFSFVGFIVAAVAAAAFPGVSFIGMGLVYGALAGMAGGVVGGEIGLDESVGLASSSDGDEEDIETGSPHFVPEPVLRALEDEEEN